MSEKVLHAMVGLLLSNRPVPSIPCRKSPNLRWRGRERVFFSGINSVHFFLLALFFSHTRMSEHMHARVCRSVFYVQRLCTHTHSLILSYGWKTRFSAENVCTPISNVGDVMRRVYGKVNAIFNKLTL